MACSLHPLGTAPGGEQGEKTDMSPRSVPFLGFLLFGVAVVATPNLSYGEDTADLILSHGVFYPVQPPGKVEGSLAVRGGRIVYLGADGGAEAPRGPATRVTD